MLGQMSRGVRSGFVPVPRPRFRKDDVLRLIQCALSHDDLHSARLYAVSRAWLARVASELFGLQRDGRLGLAPVALLAFTSHF